MERCNDGEYSSPLIMEFELRIVEKAKSKEKTTSSERSDEDAIKGFPTDTDAIGTC